jgi:hypothetical protein
MRGGENGHSENNAQAIQGNATNEKAFSEASGGRADLYG